MEHIFHEREEMDESSRASFIFRLCNISIDDFAGVACNFSSSRPRKSFLIKKIRLLC